MENLKIKRKNFFFFMAYIMFLLYKILAVSTFNEVINETINFIKISSWILFIIKIIFCNNLNLKSIITYVILLGLSIGIRIKSGSSEILEIVLITIAAKDIEFNKIAKVTLAETIFFCFIIVILGLSGVIPNYSFLRSNGEYSNSYGFIYVSKLPSFILNIIFLSIYLEDNKREYISSAKLIFYFILATLTFGMTYVRNQYIMAILFIVLYAYIVKHKKVNFDKYKILIMCIFPICIVITLFLVKNFDDSNKLYSKLDNILSTRLSVMNRVYEQSKINAFGNEIEMNGFFAINENYTYVDSGYISVLLRDGYISLGMISLSYIYLLKRNIENNNYTLVIWLCIVAISSMIDDTLFVQLNFNCIILTLLNTNTEKRKGEKNENSSCNSYI